MHASIQGYRVRILLGISDFLPSEDVYVQFLGRMFDGILDTHVRLRWIFELTKRTRSWHKLYRSCPLLWILVLHWFGHSVILLLGKITQQNTPMPRWHFWFDKWMESLLNSRCRHRQLTNRVNCERNKQGHYFPNNIFSKSIKCTVILFLEYNFFSNEKAKILQNRRMKNFVCFLLSSVVCFFCLKQENTHDPKVYRADCTVQNGPQVNP